MSTRVKNQEEILAKLGITQLNPMQLATQEAMEKSAHLILLSPTGTGKTLAFLLPLLLQLDPACEEVQLLILVPSTEGERAQRIGWKSNTGLQCLSVRLEGWLTT